MTNPIIDIRQHNRKKSYVCAQRRSVLQWISIGATRFRTTPRNSVRCRGSLTIIPKQQEMHLKDSKALADPLYKHLMDKGFTTCRRTLFSLTMHIPIIIFRPLLLHWCNKWTGVKKEVTDKLISLSWIKTHGKGRFFTAHHPTNAGKAGQSGMLQFFLDGYANTWWRP